MEIDRPFVRLPFSFDAERMADEAEQLPQSAWMQHPSRMSGNSAVALVSRNGEDNDDFDGLMQETSHLQSCPYIRQAMASFGEVFGRSRLMKLGAGAEVAQHVDFNYHWYTRVRIHVPIITNPKVTFYCADQQTHMLAGECWIFNSWRRHRVANESAEDRIHLVIDTAGSSRFWQLVRDMQQYDSLAEADKIDALVNMVGELVITQSMLGQLGTDFDLERMPKLLEGLSDGQRRRSLSPQSVHVLEANGSTPDDGGIHERQHRAHARAGKGQRRRVQHDGARLRACDA